MSDLLDKLLAKPVAPPTPSRKVAESDFSSKVEVSGDTAEVTLRTDAGEASEGTAKEFLVKQGLDPNAYEVASFKRSEWGAADKPMESVSFTFRKKGSTDEAERPPIDDMIAKVQDYKSWDVEPVARDGSAAFVVALGDMQFGKIDGDGAEGALARTVDCINRAADKLWEHLAAGYGIEHVHVAWLGDHVEGFVSQGGANAWRTGLTLNEQIRLTRRVMLHAMTTFAPLVQRLTMAAVPGNHGETIRFAGKGVTRYDDSHDTESLIAVADAAKLNPTAFGHVEFYVPQTDELTVVLEVGGLVVAHAHGHMWKPNQQFAWWKGQAFNPSSAMHMADVLLAGHLHHLHIEKDGHRTYIGVPAMEAESTWWRHSTGTGGSPGLVTAIVDDGRLGTIDLITA